MLDAHCTLHMYAAFDLGQEMKTHQQSPKMRKLTTRGRPRDEDELPVIAAPTSLELCGQLLFIKCQEGSF